MKTKLKINGEIFTGIIKYVGSNYKLVEVEGINGDFEIVIKTRGIKNVQKDDFYDFLYGMKTNSNFVSIDCHIGGGKNEEKVGFNHALVVCVGGICRLSTGEQSAGA